MRLVFLLLLLANVLLLLWYTQLRPTQADAFPSLGRNVKSLVLLNEAQDDNKNKAETPSTELASLNPPIATIDDKPLPEITILSNTEETAATSAPEPEAIPRTCHTMGPFTDIKTAESTLKKLEKLDIKTSQRSKTESEISGYRVYIPPYKTKNTALNDAKRLAEAGITDYFVITEGELENGISLGLFRDKSGAIRRMAQIRRFDFTPDMEIRHRDKTIYWLDYELRGEQLSRNQWKAIREETPQIQRLSRDCQ